MAERYLIGPDLLGRIRDVTDRAPIPSGDITSIPLRFEDVDSPRAAAKSVRIATYSGNWIKGTTKTVTPITGTTTTISAYNHFVTLDHGTCTSTQWKCAVAKDGTAWNLIQWEYQTATAVFITGVATTQVLTDITLSFNTSNCSITKTNTTAMVTGVGATVTSIYLQIPRCV